MPNRMRIAAVRDDERVELQRRARSKAERSGLGLCCWLNRG